MRSLRYIPALLVTVAIAVLSLIEAPQPILQTGLTDKTLHALGYIVQAMTLLWALWPSPRPRWRVAGLTVAYTVALGGLLELLQAYCTRTRSGDWLDLLADLIGALIGIVLAGAILRITEKCRACKTN